MIVQNTIWIIHSKTGWHYLPYVLFKVMFFFYFIIPIYQKNTLILITKKYMENWCCFKILILANLIQQNDGNFLFQQIQFITTALTIRCFVILATLSFRDKSWKKIQTFTKLSPLSRDSNLACDIKYRKYCIRITWCLMDYCRIPYTCIT